MVLGRAKFPYNLGSASSPGRCGYGVGKPTGPLPPQRGEAYIQLKRPNTARIGEGNRNLEKGETVEGTKYPPPRHRGTRQVFVPKGVPGVMYPRTS